MRRVNRDLRRVIKFDDENMDVMMDVKIDDQWKRIRPADAITAKRNTPNLSAGPAEMSSANISDFFAPNPSNMSE